MENVDIPRLALHRMRHDFLSFFLQCFETLHPSTPLQWNWHLQVLADRLADCEEGKINRLIINVPPRSLKSTLISVAWPAWLLGQDPTQKILAASYARQLSVQHALACRDILQSEWYRALFPHTRLRHDQNEKHRFATTQNGLRLATSVHGALTGEGGQVLIADDPLSAAQGHSAEARTQVNAWFEHTFSTRLNDKRRGCMVVVMQRLHEEDLSGYLLRKGGWDLLSLPAIASEAEIWQTRWDIPKRTCGALLHAAREDAMLLTRARNELGAMHFAAQYLQKPLPQEGGMVKREWFVRVEI